MQPAIIAIIYTMLGLSGFIVMVRLWRKRKDHTLGGGNRHAALLILLETDRLQMMLSLLWPGR